MAIEKKSGMNTRLQRVKSKDYDGLPDVDEDVLEIALSKIDLDPNQPRKDVGDISSLTASIEEHGVLNPIIVRPSTPGRYIVVAGERRYRAATKAQRKAALCIVRTLDEQQTAEIQLVENLHRKDLTAFEEADGYARLKTNHNYTDAQIAQKVSKSRSRVTELLSLTKIPPDVRAKCLETDIARELLYQIARQPTPEKMLSFLEHAKSGAPKEVLREKGRMGKAREGTSPKKPKWAHSSTEQKVTVVVQSHNSTLTKDRRIEALKEALKEAQA